jgi:cysteine-rich repeat protein
MHRVVWLAVLLPGCLAPAATECPGGGVCPPGLVCRMDDAEQVCVLPACGNNQPDPGETCDDGNHTSGDGCAADCLSETTALPTPRSQHALAYDESRGMAVLFGGLGQLDAVPLFQLNDTWEWNGSSWIERMPPLPLPSPRQGAGMVYDAARGMVVLFGGKDDLGQPLQDTWEWNGTSWIELTPAIKPPARVHHAMAYDSDRRKVVLFGGWAAGPLGDTWEWDGTDWVDAMPVTDPFPREQHAMAYDAGRDMVVMYGGAGDNGDIWEWDGSNWFLRKLSGFGNPRLRYGSAMAFDASSGTVALFGGLDVDNVRLNDTWAWDGTRWFETSPAGVRPVARVAHALIYDAVEEILVLFGGEAGPPPVFRNDTWEWDGTNWIERP